MKTPYLLLALAPAVFLTSCYVTPVGGPYSSGGPGGPPPRPGYSQHGDHRPGHGNDRDGHDHDRRDNDYRRDSLDRDYGHNDRDAHGSSSAHRDPRGFRESGSSGRVSTLPRGLRRVSQGGNTYYTNGSVWYRASGSGYIAVPRPN